MNDDPSLNEALLQASDNHSYDADSSILGSVYSDQERIKGDKHCLSA